MILIEMREAAYDKAFELLDKVKEHGKAVKMTLCALEDQLWECYESSKDEEDYEFEDRDEFEIPSGEESEMNYRTMRRGYRGNMGYRSTSRFGRRGMRSSSRRG